MQPPFAVVDVDAFDANAADLVRRAGGKPVRVASTSVRCRALPRRALEVPGFRGVMACRRAAFALPVVRRPGARFATVSGGGHIASGPPTWSRLPVPHAPSGLRLLRREGAGEVQTPLRRKAVRDLRLGDRVWLRHAKAGELCERFDALHLLRGEVHLETVPTYRGEGRNFG
jgi:D-serine deaminase-like pyridoxal phosphate-dependent protein